MVKNKEAVRVMRHHGRFIRYLLLLCILLLAGNTASAGTKLSPYEVRKLFTGKIAEGVHARKGYKFKAYFRTDGTIHAEYNDGFERDGKWRINDKGLKCVLWEGHREERCNLIIKDWGTYKEYKVKNHKKTHITTFHKFSEISPEQVVDIETDLPANIIRNEYAIAVVIGNANYEKIKNVDYAVNDAGTVKKYVTEVLGYKVGNVFYIADASKTDFELYFGNNKSYRGKLYNAVKSGQSDVFVYYSGHGAPGLKDKKGYFVPVEADPQYLELSGYPAEMFYRNLSKVPAKSITVVIDACFSGTTIYEKISPVVIAIDNPVVNLKDGIVLASSTGTQVSGWYNEKKHGMFTYFFLKAIHNKNADIDMDGRLTFDEIYKYVSDNSEGVPYYSRRLNGVEQTPTIEGQYQGRVLVHY